MCFVRFMGNGKLRTTEATKYMQRANKRTSNDLTVFQLSAMALFHFVSPQLLRTVNSFNKHTNAYERGKMLELFYFGLFFKIANGIQS